jgi:expansin (peptidoglycan-binding protein)
MFTLTEMLAASTALKVSGSLLSGIGGMAAGKQNYDALSWQADQAAKAGQTSAKNVYKQGAAIKGQAEADIVSQVGSNAGAGQTGTGALLLEEISNNVEIDALNAILSGKRSELAARIGASQAKLQGKMAMNQSLLAVSSAVSSAAGSYGQITKVGG